MALRLAGRRLCGATWGRGAPPVPPGLLRLGLSAPDLDDVARAAQAGGPGEALGWLVQRGRLEGDVVQHRAAERLDACWHAIHAYTAELPGWERQVAAWEAECARLRQEHDEKRAREESQRREAGKGRGEAEQPTGGSAVSAETGHEEGVEPLVLPPAPPKPTLTTPGCYLWGEVGRGKTLLMDLFVFSLRQPCGDIAAQEQGGAVVRRAHFHDFMHGVHRRINQQRHEGSRAGLFATIAEVAEGRPAVLCFDEFQITNIADATLLVPMFSELFGQDVAIVATSNRSPKALYQGGLNRESHLPALTGALEARLHVHHLDAPKDYREVLRQSEAMAGNVGDISDFMLKRADDPPDADVRLSEAFAAASGNVAPDARMLPVAWGRQMQCGAVAGGVARFTFDELCGQPLSAEDYSAMVTRAQIHTFVVSDVPRFSLKLHNEARRFTNLVDALYEHQCRLVCTSAAPIDEVLAGMDLLCSVEAQPEPPAPEEPSLRKHGDVTFAVSGASPCRPDTFATAEADAEAGTSVLHLGTGADSSEGQDGIVGVMSAAADSLRESGFAARRCASRLREMGTATYRTGHETRWLCDSAGSGDRAAP